MDKDLIKEFKVKIRQGSVGNTEWWTDADWEAHRIHVEKLKAAGEYLKEVEHTVSFVPHPLFTDPVVESKPEMKFIILDLKQHD